MVESCPRAGWDQQLLLEWLPKQCGHPAQRTHEPLERRPVPVVVVKVHCGKHKERQ